MTTDTNKQATTTTPVSVVIVAWNAKDYVSECLHSLQHQTICIPLEVIVVDNHSADGTAEMVSQEFPEVILIRNAHNLGFAGGNNEGIRRSTGNHIFLINSDVNVPPDCLNALYVYIEQHPEIGILGPRMVAPDGKTARSCMRFPTLWNSFCRALGLDSVFRRSKLFGGFLMRDFNHDHIASVDVLNGWFWMVRRTALDQVGLLDERFFMYGEDIDWCRRFHDAGWKVVLYPGAEALHYGGASSAIAPVRFSIEMERANLQCWSKHNGRVRLIGYVLITLLHHALRILGYLAVYVFRRSARQQAVFKVKKSLACARWLVAPQLSAGGKA